MSTLQADLVWIQQPLWSRCAVCMHAFGFNAGYVLILLSLLFRWNWIRVPAIALCTAKVYAGAVSAPYRSKPCPLIVSRIKAEQQGVVSSTAALFWLGTTLGSYDDPLEISFKSQCNSADLLGRTHWSETGAAFRHVNS